MIFFLIFLFFIIVFIVAFVNFLKKSNDVKTTGKQYEGVLKYASLKHASGLPTVPAGVDIYTYIRNDDVIFLNSNQEFKILNKNILSVNVVNGSDFDAGGAAIGFLTMGIVGAAIGSTKEYIVVTYKSSSGETKAIAFEHTSLDILNALKDICKLNQTTTEHIEL